LVETSKLILANRFEENIQSTNDLVHLLVHAFLIWDPLTPKELVNVVRKVRLCSDISKGFTDFTVSSIATTMIGTYRMY